MNFFTKKIFKIFILVLFFPFTSAANVLVHSIPYIIEISKQALFSIMLISGYLLNIKPEFPSTADQNSYQADGIQKNFFQQFLQDVSKQTGITITPEILTQLKNAGIHHDYQKLESLLFNLEKNKSIGYIGQKTEINPYALAQGIKKFQQPGTYSQTSSTDSKFHHRPALMGIQTFTNPGQKKDYNPQQNNTAIKNNEPQEYSYEFPTKLKSPTTQQLVLNDNVQESTKSFHTTKYMHQMMQQQIDYSQSKALYEWQKAYTSVIEHFHTPSLRSQLKKTIQSYQKIIDDACRIGGSSQAIQAQTQIALQGLPLPGFLNEISEVLQEKISRICFLHSGDWKGAETEAQLQELQQAFKPFQNLINTLSFHFEWENQSHVQDCIEELYLLDQGRGNWASRFFNWMNTFFDSQAISLVELQSRIAQSPFNQQAFTALELLEKNEFKLARTPLEDMAHSAKTANSVQLNQWLFEQYQQKISTHYGTANIPLKYQNDPVFWLYKPSTTGMKLNDPALALIEGHLGIRDAIYNQILKAIGKNKNPSPLIRHLAYNLIDKLDDPIGFIEQLEFLKSDSQNPEIKEACAAFFNKGVLNLFGLKKQASHYRVLTSDILNQSEYAHMRTALNKLLLVDARSEESKRSLKLVFDCMPHACSNNPFSKEYQNIIHSITQAHTDAKAPKEILHISCFPISPSSDLQITLLKAMGKAASADINPLGHVQNNPLSTREAWACIKKIQDLDHEGKTSEAHALTNTYLRGYLDEKMPIAEYTRPIIITTAGIAGIWLANSQKQSPKPTKIFDHPQSNIPSSSVSDNENEEIKKYKGILEEILSNAKPGRETTSTKLKQYEKEGGFEQATQDFEKLNPSKVRNIPKGQLGDLLNGIRINVRIDSSDKRPTLEIYNSTTDQRLKIRYNI